MNNELDEEVILNTQEETTTTPQEEVETDESSEEDVEELRARLAKAEELANNYKIRAEKAERKGDEPKTPKVAPKKSSDLSTLDIIAISKADIEPEDVEDVVEYAKFKGISVSEALKTPVMQTTLSQKKEMRQTALATSTGSTRRGTSQISDSQLLANASKGILPDSDADIERLAQLKVFRKR
jgi:hypothetical protein